MQIANRRWHDHSRQGSRRQRVGFKVFDLLCGNVNVTGLVCLEIQPRAFALRLPSLMANGETVFKRGNIRRARAQRQRRDHPDDFSETFHLMTKSTTAATPQASFDRVTIQPFCFNSGAAFSMINARPAKLSISASL